MKETRHLSTGRIQMTTVTKKDYEKRGSSIPGVALDIYRHVSSFNETLYCIQKIQPSFGNTIPDVLSEFISKYGETYFIVILAENVKYDFPPSGDIDQTSAIIGQQKKELTELGFWNIMFNRKCSNIYSRGDIYIYPNDITRKFIQDNNGDVTSDKIVNSISLKLNHINDGDKIDV